MRYKVGLKQTLVGTVFIVANSEEEARTIAENAQYEHDFCEEVASNESTYVEESNQEGVYFYADQYGELHSRRFIENK